MINLRDNFQPGAPVSQVPAGWFNTVAGFINRLVGGPGVRVWRDSDPPQINLEPDEVKELLDIPSDDHTTCDDHTDSPGVYDSTGGTWTWAAGGTNGLELDCYCKIAPQASGSNYTVLQRCRLTFSKDGLLVVGELLSDRIRIQARNA